MDPPIYAVLYPYWFQFGEDGRSVLSAGYGDVRRFDPTTGRALAPPLRYDSQIEAVDLSPDGRTVLIGYDGAAAWLWDSATGRPLGPPLRHQSGVVRVTNFSPDGSDSADRQH